jgi:hypothetical protein
VWQEEEGIKGVKEGSTYHPDSEKNKGQARGKARRDAKLQ